MILTMCRISYTTKRLSVFLRVCDCMVLPVVALPIFAKATMGIFRMRKMVELVGVEPTCRKSLPQISHDSLS